ncbi:hypothetical protein FB451DRAFT_1162489 [Mycena latifolia]|nr:hypothetical protein FB451DRAFT_1162489 [Mycena latifolia]
MATSFGAEVDSYAGELKDSTATLPRDVGPFPAEYAKDVKDEFWPKTSSLSKRIESARPPPRCGPIPVRPRVMQWMPSTRNLVPWSRRRALHEHPPTLEISSPKSREGWRTHQHNARQRLKWVEANVRGTELEEAATGREAALRGLERVAT